MPERDRRIQKTWESFEENVVKSLYPAADVYAIHTSILDHYVDCTCFGASRRKLGPYSPDRLIEAGVNADAFKEAVSRLQCRIRAALQTAQSLQHLPFQGLVTSAGGVYGCFWVWVLIEATGWAEGRIAIGVLAGALLMLTPLSVVLKYCRIPSVVNQAERDVAEAVATELQPVTLPTGIKTSSYAGRYAIYLIFESQRDINLGGAFERPAHGFAKAIEIQEALRVRLQASNAREAAWQATEAEERRGSELHVPAAASAPGVAVAVAPPPPVDDDTPPPLASAPGVAIAVAPSPPVDDDTPPPQASAPGVAIAVAPPPPVEDRSSVASMPPAPNTAVHDIVDAGLLLL